jgi:hypothetical protein
MEQNTGPFARYANLFRDFNERRAPVPQRETNYLAEIAHDYNRNTRYYNDNIRDYNENIRLIIQGLMNSRSTPPSFDISMNMSFWEFPLNPTSRINQRTNLSREQIASNTLTYGYTNEMQDAEIDASGNVCPISLEQFQVGDVICEIRGCGHKFKRPNLMHWLRRNSRCPVCRYDLMTNGENAETIPVAEIPNENDDLQNSLSDILQSLITNSLDASGNLIYPRI